MESEGVTGGGGTTEGVTGVTGGGGATEGATGVSQTGMPDVTGAATQAGDNDKTAAAKPAKPAAAAVPPERKKVRNGLQALRKVLCRKTEMI